MIHKTCRMAVTWHYIRWCCVWPKWIITFMSVKDIPFSQMSSLTRKISGGFVAVDSSNFQATITRHYVG